jgi:hypothetical protein
VKTLLKFLRTYRKYISVVRTYVVPTFPIISKSEPLILQNKDFDYNYQNEIDAQLINNFLDHRYPIFNEVLTDVNFLADTQSMRKRGGTKKILTPRDDCFFKKKINFVNRKHAFTIYKMIDSQYKFIDWQLDFKSGFRWQSNINSKMLQHANINEVDVKVPWELARMHHLVNMALAYKAESNASEKIIYEFRNQILDFICTNPPGFGVNWICPMDIAIRSINMITSLEILKSKGVKLDKFFLNAFQCSLLAHGNYIYENLEIENSIRANHYLANLIGLAKISTILPISRKTNGWLAYSIQEIEKEMHFQFQDDGSNFEGSTYYHCESLEFITYGMLLIESLPKERVNKAINTKNSYFRNQFFKPKLVSFKPPASHLNLVFSLNFYRRYIQAIQFIDSVSKPDFSLPLIGDNDSGKLFHLFFLNPKLPTDDLLHRPSRVIGQELLLACNIIFNIEFAISPHINVNAHKNFYDFLDIQSLRRKVSSLIDNSSLHLKPESISKVTRQLIFPKYKEHFKELERIQFDVDTRELLLHHFSDFGLIIYKSQNLYLSIRSYLDKHQNPTSHFHCDQLSLNLQIYGRDIYQDPGSYCYQSSPSLRNKYRSADSHISPFSNEDYGALTKNTFEEINMPLVQINSLKKDSSNFIFLKDGRLSKLEVIIADSKLTLIFYNCLLNKPINNKNIYVSPSYGVISSQPSYNV